MKFIKLRKAGTYLLLVSLVSGLSACTSMRHGNSPSEPLGSASVAGAQSHGVGDGVAEEGESWSDNTAGTSVGYKGNLLAEKTYYFDFDKSDVKEEFRPAVFANADWLASHPQAKILLEGHTDPRGSREYNVALGERRAESVAALLKSRGVNSDQIRVVSYGMEKPAVPGHTESAYEKDRRAVIVIAEK